MRAIVLLNPNENKEKHDNLDHLLMQKIVLAKFLCDQPYKIVQLNPLQVETFYTIPHALLYDLQKSKDEPLDCLIIYSPQSIHRFVAIYPEKWLMICKYFHDIKTITGAPFYTSTKALRQSL